MIQTIALAALTITGAHGVLTLPDIGAPAYSASCAITQAWEDGSAHAYCTEDGASYTFDPDGSPEIAKPHNRIPSWSAGWYPIN